MRLGNSVNFSWTTGPSIATRVSDTQMFNQKLHSPMLWRLWTRSMAGRMKKSGWDRNSPHVCGSSPKRCWQVGKYPLQKWRSTWSAVCCPLSYAWTGSVLDLSTTTSGCQKAQLPSMWKRWWAWNWITKSIFRVLYNGACYGFQRQRG